ncbi:hypothetical protein [Conexibacter woesei]|uniref:hypothetical protein n=1 Tax=Conexibacter woesei TaxID=191495 RepID=UPI00047C3207|nr:hypothetical protein [Conexibacter woesei]
MDDDVLNTLFANGASAADASTVRVYHATSVAAAEQILAAGELRPALPTDPAERVLVTRRGGTGSVFIATTPAIHNDLSGGQIVIAFDLPRDTPGEIIRVVEDPPRAEAELTLTAPLRPRWLDRLDRTIGFDDLSLSARTAIELFRNSPVGDQLQQSGEASGRCKRASARFIAALRSVDDAAGRAARIIEWVGDGGFHHAVLLAEHEAVVDFTIRQFDKHSRAPFPCVRTRGQAEVDWGCGELIDLDDPLGRWLNNFDRF